MSPQSNILVFPSGLAGVFINQLPEDQQIPFKKWLEGQTITAIEEQPFAYACDYSSWYNSWIKDKVSFVID